MVDGFAKTSRYVLNEGSYPSCPSVLQAPDGHATVIYGFSGKQAYNVFLSASSFALMPYPLVKGFLKNQIELDSGTLKLVVLDAVSAAEPCLYAATFQSVLESQELGSGCVSISHRLVLDEPSSLYRIEASSFSASMKAMS